MGNCLYNGVDSVSSREVEKTVNFNGHCNPFTRPLQGCIGQGQAELRWGCPDGCVLPIFVGRGPTDDDDDEMMKMMISNTGSQMMMLMILNLPFPSSSFTLLTPDLPPWSCCPWLDILLATQVLCYSSVKRNDWHSQSESSVLHYTAITSWGLTCWQGLLIYLVMRYFSFIQEPPAL